MKRLISILPILSLLLAACTPDPYADAEITPNPAWVGEDITFTNYSTNTDHTEWDMGDGSSSAAFNVVHYYIDPGRYEVTMRAFGKKNGVDVAKFYVDVDGSELKIIVLDFYDEFAIEEASVLLYASESDWWEADPAKAVGGEQFTNRYGECWFEGLSYQRYYVDVYYRYGNEGYVNWLLGEDDINRWVRTQEVPGGYDHIFTAYVEAVTFDDQKKSAGRPVVRPPLREIQRINPAPSPDMPVKENKKSVKVERK